jgi:hypothetical protein
MIVNKETIATATGTALAAVGTSIQPDEILRYVSLIITIIGGLITLVTAIWGLVAKIKAWHKKAMEDGKIDDAEKEELKGIIKEGINDGKQAIDDINKQIKKKGETK